MSAKHQVALILLHGPLLRESSSSYIWMVCEVSPGHRRWTSFCPTSSCGQCGSDQFVQTSTTFAQIQCAGTFLLPVSCFLGFLCCCDVGCPKDFWSWTKLHRLRAWDSFTSGTSCKVGGPQTTFISDQLATNSVVPTIPSGSIIH